METIAGAVFAGIGAGICVTLGMFLVHRHDDLFPSSASKRMFCSTCTGGIIIILVRLLVFYLFTNVFDWRGSVAMGAAWFVTIIGTSWLLVQVLFAAKDI